MENKVTISELPELFYAEGTESIPVDSYDALLEKNKTFQVKIDVIKDYIESKLNLGGSVTEEQILAWDAKETPQGAQDKVDAGLVLAKEYTDQELVAIQTAISGLEGLLTSDDVDLDELQEIVDFIKLNRSDLDALTTASITGLDDALSLKADSATVNSALEDKADVSALEGLATTESVNSALAGKADVSALEGLATTESVTQALADKADVSALADKADVTALADKADVTALEGLATTESVTQALADKADVTALADKVDSDYLDLALADKADVAVDFVTVAEAYTIEEKDLGKVLYVTADVTLTISDQSTLTEGFNCKIIKAEDTLTVGVELTGSDSIRGDIGTVEGDVTLIKAPVAGKFLLV